MNNRKFLRALVLASAAAILASCSSMEKMVDMGEKVALNGSSEVPAVNTDATGSAWVLVGKDCSVKATVKVSGMTATASHIHMAAAGANGPVIVPFTKTGDNEFAAAEGAKMTEAQCAAYKAGGTYVNVHSAKVPSGEIRAQLAGK